MAVVNNGGGNKLDAYLSVNTRYDPGTCTQDVRVGHIAVTLHNGAPTHGLPAYVSPRSDLIEQHLPEPEGGKQPAHRRHLRSGGRPGRPGDG